MRPDLALVRSLSPAVGAAMFTMNRVLAAPVLVSQAALAAAEPQAVVVNAGIANAATGERGSSTRGRRRPTPRGCSTCGRAGARALDGRDRGRCRSPLPPGSTPPPRALVRRRRGRGRRDPDHGRGAEAGGRVRRVHRRRDGEGRRDDPPRLATMLAVVTTDYPLEPGEAHDSCARGRGELQPHLRGRRVLDERHRRPARQRRARRSRATTRRSRRRSGRCAPTSPRRSSPTARARPSWSRSRSRAPRRARGGGDRPPHRHLAAREDRRFRARRELGPRARRGRLAPYNGGFAQLEPDRLTLAFNGTPSSPAGAGGRGAGRRGRRLDRARPRARRGRAAYLTCDLSYDYVRINAEYRREPDRAQVRRRRRRSDRGRLAAREGARSASSTAPGRRSRPRWRPAFPSASSAAGG